MQQSLEQLRLVSCEKDAWRWENVHFSVHKRIRGRQGTQDETTIRACQAIYKQKVPLKAKSPRIASPEEKAGDLSIREKNVSRHIRRIVLC